MALEPLICTADVENGSDVVTIHGAVLNRLNCVPPAGVLLAGLGYSVAEYLTTVSFRMSRAWEGADAAGISCEIAPWTPEMSSRIELSKQLRDYSAQQALLDARGNGLFYGSIGFTAYGDPGPGRLARDTVDWADVTALYIDTLDASSSAIDQAAIIKRWGADLLLVIESIETGEYVAFTLSEAAVDETGWYSLSELAYVGGNGPADGEGVRVVFVPSGTPGKVSGLRLKWDGSSTADADPGAGKVRGNDLTNPSWLYVSKTDVNGTSIAGRLATLDDAVNAVARASMSLQPIDGSSSFLDVDVIGALVDATTYFKVPVILRAGTVPSDGAQLAANLKISGKDGTNGANGITAGLRYLYSTTTTDSDPGNGTLRFNNAAPASATAAYIDNLDADGATVTGSLDTWDDSTATIKGVLTVRSVLTPATFAQFNVTGSVVDGTGYRKLTLTYLAGNGTLANADAVALTFSRTGDNGGGDMLSTNNLSDVSNASAALANLGLGDLFLTVSQIALQVADNTNVALFLGNSGNVIADSFDTLTYVDVAGATNLNSSIAGVLKPVLSYVDTLSARTLASNAAGFAGYTVLTIIPASALSTNGTKVRLSLKPPSTGTNGVIANCFIGHAAVSGDAYDFDGNQARVTFNGSNGVTLTVGGAVVVSDEITFALDETKNLIVAMDFTSGDIGYNTAETGFSALYRAASTEAGTTNKTTGYTSSGSTHNFGVSKIEVRGSSASNMTVRSASFTAAAVPTTMKAVLRVKEVDAATAGTDYTLECSRDGGTTWATMTLTELFTSPSPTASIRVVEAAATDVSGQPSGTAPRWRFKTLNNKMVELRGACYRWS